MTQKPVRVRFAPSPTGPLHIGGVRTALYNYWFARHHGGTMVLRLEDTDQGRFVAGAEDYLREALTWIGVNIDEGLGTGGPHGPYRQSERKDLYQQYVQKLLDEGHAYYAFDTAEELEAMRKSHPNFQYGVATRGQLNNSLTLSPAATEQKLKDNVPCVVRIKMPDKATIHFEDLIRGKVQVQSDQLDDKVLLKSDGMPTYHLANVVDDHLMDISHVIRGEEWLPSAPMHVLLYRFMGWEEAMPQFAHLPLLLKPKGKGKLSKRDADQMGFPIFPLSWKDPATGAVSEGFRERGYLPAALANFLALLGWNPGTEQEIFTPEALTAAFSLERVAKAGARFDIAKARWFNEQYLKQVSADTLAGQLLEEAERHQHVCSHEMALQIVAVLRDRISFAHELFEQGQFFFQAPTTYDPKAIAKRWNEEAKQTMSAIGNKLSDASPFTAEAIQQQVAESTTEANMGMGKIMPLLRLAMVGSLTGPDLPQSMAILGQDETNNRIEAFLQRNPL